MVNNIKEWLNYVIQTHKINDGYLYIHINRNKIKLDIYNPYNESKQNLKGFISDEVYKNWLKYDDSCFIIKGGKIHNDTKTIFKRFNTSK